MPVVFNIAAHLALGSLLGSTARRSKQFRQDLISWPLIVLVAFHAVLAAPSATYWFRFYPQWSLLYAFDPQVFPELDGWIGVLSAAVVLVNLIAGVTGLLLTRVGVLKGSKILERLPLVFGALGWCAGLFVYGERAIWVGTYDAYWQDQATLVLYTLPGAIGLAVYILAAVFVVWIGRRFGNHDPSYL